MDNNDCQRVGAISNVHVGNDLEELVDILINSDYLPEPTDAPHRFC